MVIVSIFNHGVGLDRVSDGKAAQQIYVTWYNWLYLCRLAPEIDTAMSEKTQKQWILGPSGSDVQEETKTGSPVHLMATVEKFEGSAYCNIRVFVGGQATKQGVTLKPVEWKHLMHYLHDSPETGVAKAVVRQDMMDAVKSACADCLRPEDVPITQHKCQDYNFVEGELGKYELPAEGRFQRKLAEACSKAACLMQRPRDVYKMIGAHCITLIKDDILCQYEWQ